MFPGVEYCVQVKLFVYTVDFMGLFQTVQICLFCDKIYTDNFVFNHIYSSFYTASLAYYTLISNEVL